MLENPGAVMCLAEECSRKEIYLKAKKEFDEIPGGFPARSIKSVSRFLLPRVKAKHSNGRRKTRSKTRVRGSHIQYLTEPA
jgi:hypothetical protein